MNSKNKSGARCEPCGTPHVNVLLYDTASSTLTDIVLSDRKLCSQLTDSELAISANLFKMMV